MKWFCLVASVAFCLGAVGEEFSPESSHAWVEVDTNLFARNIRIARDLVGDRVKLCAIMKADAYGCGIRTLMPHVIESGVECIGIAANEEAVAVRESGYTGRVCRVRLATNGEINGAVGQGVEELVGSLEFARRVDRIAAARGRRIRFHLALNSGGMDRNGLDLTMPGALDEAVAICSRSHLEIVGIMTHFPIEDTADIHPGLDRFLRESAAVIKAAKLDRSKLTLHAANTYAAISVPAARLDMVRTGSLFYQNYGITNHTIFAFKTRVAAVNAYPKGSTVCYDRTFVLKRDSRLANLPVGYSDGYLRAFGNKGKVLIRGHRASIVGVISMNTCLADVTDFPDVQTGDEVVLFGRQGAEEITESDISAACGMPIYEVFLMWGRLNPRFAVAP